MRILCWLGIFSCGLSSAALPADQQPPARRPNILFLVADDLATRLGCYGDTAAITPYLDRLAAEGVVFTHAYYQGAVCTPSRTSFMLGLNNRHTNANSFLDNPELMTLGRWFREHGYQTFSVGKIDHTDDYTDPRAWDIRHNVAEAADTGSIVREHAALLEREFGPPVTPKPNDSQHQRQTRPQPQPAN